MEIRVDVDEVVSKLCDTDNEDHVKEIILNTLYEQGEAYTELVIESNDQVNKAKMETAKLRMLLDVIGTMLECDDEEIPTSIAKLGITVGA